MFVKTDSCKYLDKYRSVDRYIAIDRDVDEDIYTHLYVNERESGKVYIGFF